MVSGGFSTTAGSPITRHNYRSASTTGAVSLIQITAGTLENITIYGLCIINQ
jgi:hypothetical protein